MLNTDETLLLWQQVVGTTTGEILSPAMWSLGQMNHTTRIFTLFNVLNLLN